MGGGGREGFVVGRGREGRWREGGSGGDELEECRRGPGHVPAVESEPKCHGEHDLGRL